MWPDRPWLNFEMKFLSRDLIWPFKKKKLKFVLDLPAIFDFFTKSVRIGFRAPLPLPGVLKYYVPLNKFNIIYGIPVIKV
jgi:hypothetical protein